MNRRHAIKALAALPLAPALAPAAAVESPVLAMCVDRDIDSRAWLIRRDGSVEAIRRTEGHPFPVDTDDLSQKAVASGYVFSRFIVPTIADVYYLASLAARGEWWRPGKGWTTE